MGPTDSTSPPNTLNRDNLLGFWMGTIFLLSNILPRFSLLAASESPTYGLSWGLIQLSIVLGLLVTLKSSGRKTEVKKRGTSFDKE